MATQKNVDKFCNNRYPLCSDVSLQEPVNTTAWEIFTIPEKVFYVTKNTSSSLSPKRNFVLQQILWKPQNGKLPSRLHAKAEAQNSSYISPTASQEFSHGNETSPPPHQPFATILIINNIVYMKWGTVLKLQGSPGWHFQLDFVYTALLPRKDVEPGYFRTCTDAGLFTAPFELNIQEAVGFHENKSGDNFPKTLTACHLFCGKNWC